jgi:hypothetical protein
MPYNDLIWIIQYQEQALNWQLWINSAEELLAASKKLEPSIKRYWSAASENFQDGRYNVPMAKPRLYLQMVYSMLVAYAIENLLKASLILQNEKQYRQEILNTSKLPEKLKSSKHSLVKLAKDSNLHISIEETNLLYRLSRNSHWQGRYPVPINAKELNSVVMDGNMAHFVAYLAPNDLMKLKVLIKRIKKHIKDNCSES